MIRTAIQFTALILTIISAFFLIRGTLNLTTKRISELHGGWFGNPRVVVSLAEQQADTKVGFCILLVSFALQMANSLWPMRWLDFGINKKGVVVSIAVSALILISAWFLSDHLRDKTLREISEVSDVFSGEEDNPGKERRVLPNRKTFP